MKRYERRLSSSLRMSLIFSLKMTNEFFQTNELNKLLNNGRRIKCNATLHKHTFTFRVVAINAHSILFTQRINVQIVIFILNKQIQVQKQKTKRRAASRVFNVYFNWHIQILYSLTGSLVQSVAIYSNKHSKIKCNLIQKKSATHGTFPYFISHLAWCVSLCIFWNHLLVQWFGFSVHEILFFFFFLL